MNFLSKFRRLLGYSVIFTLISCQTTSHLQTLQGGPVNKQSLSKGEKRLWSMSEDAEIQIRRSGKIFKDIKSQQALENILYRLYPEQKGNMKIKIIKRPILNAFAFPNGSLYIHTGIISAAKNEAQIASVVAHEGAHFILKHSAKSRIKRNNMTSFILMVNLMGVPLLGELIGISSISGYSKDLEREADLVGAERMLAAGYDVNEAHKIFEFMASEAKANEIDEPFFFATHPRLLERIENFKKFSDENNLSSNVYGTNPLTYNQQFSSVNNYALHKKLEIGRYSSLINELSFHSKQWQMAKLSEDKIVYAEAYRLRGKKGDITEAKILLNSIQTEAPEYWKTYLSLGVIALQEGDYSLAKQNLLRAKSLSKNDNSYIDMYLNKINKNGDNNND